MGVLGGGVRLAGCIGRGRADQMSAVRESRANSRVRRWQSGQDACGPGEQSLSGGEPVEVAGDEGRLADVLGAGELHDDAL